MTYNIRHGEGMDGRVDLERIAEIIRREGADIVALQEVDRGVARTARRDLSGELAALTGMTCVFSNNFHFQGGEYGNALLTRFPVREWRNRHYRMLREGEQRGCWRWSWTWGRRLVVLNTHLDFRPDDAERLSNVAEIMAAAATAPTPTR
jgi:endonuclease/exonuclease/phosphatase family metal-dependent hydrolase